MSGRCREDELVESTVILPPSSPASVLDSFSIRSTSTTNLSSQSFKTKITLPLNDESPSPSLASTDNAASLANHAHINDFSADAVNPLAPMSGWLGDIIAYVLGCSGSNCAEDDGALTHSEHITGSNNSMFTLSEDATPPSTDAVCSGEAAGSHGLSDRDLSSLWQLGAVKGTWRRSYGIGVPRRLRNEPHAHSIATAIKATKETAARQSSHAVSDNWLLDRWMTDYGSPRDLKSEWISGIEQSRVLKNHRLYKYPELNCRERGSGEGNAIWRRRHFVALAPLALGAEEVAACDRPKVVFGKQKTEMAVFFNYLMD